MVKINQHSLFGSRGFPARIFLQRSPAPPLPPPQETLTTTDRDASTPCKLKNVGTTWGVGGDF